MTAVEFLESEMPKLVYIAKSNKVKFDELINQAKEMEKEQHRKTFKQARLAKIFEKDMPPVWESWQQYYNETFKSE